MSDATTETERSIGLTDDEEKRFAKLLGPAQAGNEKALAEVRPIIERGGMWPYIGNLARKVEEVWLDAMTGRNKIIREGYRRRADELRGELLAAGDSPLERLLVDRVVACWLQVAHADITYASLLNGESHVLRVGAHFQERQDRAHVRVPKAMRALATVRRLLVPAVQINGAEKQIVTQHAGAARTEGA